MTCYDIITFNNLQFDRLRGDHHPKTCGRAPLYVLPRCAADHLRLSSTRPRQLSSPLVPQWFEFFEDSGLRNAIGGLGAEPSEAADVRIMT
jgi:hypothetical protein